ncbi:putative cell wall protein [Carex littledalei]|uniref:Putative cell wall protein n=1 Tax=Carex littledalei TaxID=544730 RepID=A0A833R7G4_9POAL|nr:putative cell wall protein [Carex littledalei]
MASNSKPCYLSILLLLIIFSSFTQLSVAARPTPRTEKTVAKSTTQASSTDKKQTDCEQESSVVVPGIGRYMAGSNYHGPDFSGLDHSIPAATHAQYLPGIDDTIIPNPGLEIPNPFFHPSNP